MTKRSRQLPLALVERPGWGGRRDKAGRKATGSHPRLPHVARERFGRALPLHVTLRMRAGVPSLRVVPIVREIQKRFAAGCERPGFRLVQYSLQGNHAHMIVEASDQAALGRGMKAIGARLARAVNRISGRHGPVLAHRYHHELLPTPRQVRNALRYVLLNARRHAARAGAALARKARPDPASSARWFDGWSRSTHGTSRDGPEPARDDASPVARARTWLLAVGWRRHGLLDPADAPG